eukprot:766195-Hanusia_phi.AAC.13
MFVSTPAPLTLIHPPPPHLGGRRLLGHGACGRARGHERRKKNRCNVTHNENARTVIINTVGPGASDGLPWAGSRDWQARCAGSLTHCT